MTAIILHRAKRDTAFAAKSVHAKQTYVHSHSEFENSS